MVFYRKYRPQTIQELDSAYIRETLSSVLSQKDPPHAFLFTGPKGLGKTSTARIVAKVINCERRASSKLAFSSKEEKLNARRYKLDDNKEPCNRCSQCISIMNGTNLDVLEIDGASNRGIDEIRDLREKIRLAPVSAQKKVYIIDEVHMLTTEAFNALLKTLEEPPEHVIFILCTTEPQKVPATISSRCFHISFQKATTEDLIRSFNRIVESERILINKEALSYIAELSDGGFRDGTKILEELSLLSKGQKITRELIEQTYKVTNIDLSIEGLIKSLAGNNMKASFKIIKSLENQGTDMKYFIEQMVKKLHVLLLVKLGVEKDTSDGFPSLSVDDMKQMISLLTKAHSELKYAVLPQLPLELAIVEWNTKMQNNIPLTPTLSHKGRGSSLSVDKAGEIVSQRDSASGSASFSDDHNKKEIKTQDESDLWKQLIEKVKAHNHSIAGVLRGCSLKSYNSEELVIQTGYSFHRDRLNEPKTYSLLEKVCKEITGNNVKVKVLLVKG